MKHTLSELRQKQSLPLDQKIRMSINRVKQWYEKFDGEVYVAYSGGKDSIVLLNIVRSIYPEVKAVFCDTGLELPDVRKFAKQTHNTVVLRPKMSFRKIIQTHGYPVVSKAVSQFINEARTTKSEKLRNIRLNGKPMQRIPDKHKYLLNAPFKISEKCCDIMKKNPSKLFEKETGLHPIIGTMTDESLQRQKIWIDSGCNSFDAKRPTSKPLSFWRTSDVWEYIRLNNLKYPEAYNKGFARTGCAFCMFGLQLEANKRENLKNNFQILQTEYPKLYNVAMNHLGVKEVLQFMGVKYSNDAEMISFMDEYEI